MHTRQSTAEAPRSINNLDNSTTIDVDDSCERWGIRIAETELATGQVVPSDILEWQFLKADDREVLRAITHAQES